MRQLEPKAAANREGKPTRLEFNIDLLARSLKPGSDPSKSKGGISGCDHSCRKGPTSSASDSSWLYWKEAIKVLLEGSRIRSSR
ncbi:hypothetical protein KSP40_PGU021503 [Platanthera guangdongensis]|uniref:Uncharacterized protein n=1 Tax=Platanthera guangdongensis TaxID=2320717 RepID=A0ABR2LS75_9ASPA